MGAGVWCEGSNGAGELSSQGIVSAQGKTDRFDQIFGTGWFVIAVDAPVKQCLSEQYEKLLDRLDGKLLKIGGPRTECNAFDVEGSYARWMKVIDCNYFVLHPDFYLAATAKTPHDLSAHLDTINLSKYLHELLLTA